MTTQAPRTGPGEIQLHFCQRCGISIPQIDIDSGRAQAAPGGYVCAGCAHRHSRATADLPRILPAPTPTVAVPRGGDLGARVLTTLALLYVVGATTFLLVRETGREPAPEVDLGHVATAESVAALAAKVDEVEERSQRALSNLKESDDQQRIDLRALSGKVNGLTTETEKLTRNVRADIEDLQATVVQIANRTGLVKDDVASVLEELRTLAKKVEEAPAGGATGPTVQQPDPGEKPEAGEPAKTKDELERERRVREYVAQLADRSGGDKGNQERYNAAVQLGDLKDPAAVPALIDALRNDPYDLVRRAAAWSLGSFGKEAVPAIPALIEEIGGKEEYVGYMCERALGEITKAVLGAPVSFDFDPTMSATQRRKVQRKWEEWWAEHKAQLLPDG